METRANYVLIGACALVGILLGLGFFVWLAKFQIDRQYAYYDVLFDNVSGLSRAADVRFSGLSRRAGGVARPRRRRRPGGCGCASRSRPTRRSTRARPPSSRPRASPGSRCVSVITPGDTSKPLLRDTAAACR